MSQSRITFAGAVFTLEVSIFFIVVLLAAISLLREYWIRKDYLLKAIRTGLF